MALGDRAGGGACGPVDSAGSQRYPPFQEATLGDEFKEARMTETNLARLHAIVEGRVQGVGFRYFVLEVAELLGIYGWVRNRWDDTVEVLAEGERSALEKLQDALGRGPRGAFVTSVKADWEKPTGEFQNFRVAVTE